MATDSTGITTTVDLNSETFLAKVASWLETATLLLPNIIIALAFITFMWLIGFLVRKAAHTRGSDNPGQVSGGFIRWAVFTFGGLLALTIV
jgi:small conductance mechanosensitive channel